MEGASRFHYRIKSVRLSLLKRMKTLLSKIFQKEDEPIELYSIILYVNSICNAKCLMCDIGQKNKKGIDLLRASNRNVHLDINLLKKLLDDPYIKGKEIGFNIVMTEPLLTPNLCDMIRLIKKGGHYTNVTTNGFLLLEKAKDLIDAGLDSIQVSLDGPEKIHDKIRGGRFYKKAIEGMRLINKYSNMRVSVNYTIFNLNYLCILDFLKGINKEVKLDIVKFQFMDFVSKEMMKKQNENYPIKHTESCISEIISPRKVNIKKLSEELSSIKLSDYENIKEISIIPYLISEKELTEYFSIEGKKIKDNSKCVLPWHSLAFTTDGKLLIHMRCFNYVYGDFTKNNLEDLFVKGKKIKWFRKQLKKADYCFPVCSRCCGVMKYTYGVK